MARKSSRHSSQPKSSFVVIGIVIGIIIMGGVFYFEGLMQASASAQINTGPESGAGTATAKIAAVSAEGDRIGNGVIGEVSVKIIDGSGKILVTTEPFAEFDTQRSVQIAATAAEKITGMDLGKKDLLVSFKISDGAASPEVIGGPSAGISITAAVIAAMENLTIRPDVVMTGTIDENGNVGKVGGVPEKAKAAAEAGAKLFVAPVGSGNVEYYTKETTTDARGNFKIIRVSYVPKITSLNDYTKQFGMESIEVAAVKDALPYIVLPSQKERAQEIAIKSPKTVLAGTVPEVLTEGCGAA